MHQGLSGERDGLAQEQHWLLLVEQLLRQSRGAIGAGVPRHRLAPAQLQQVRDYCEAGLEHKIGIEELAALCGLDRFQFLRGFRQAVGMTPHAWLTRLRLERACLSLARGQRNLAALAQEVGFYDQSHFARAFRQAYGVPPSRY